MSHPSLSPAEAERLEMLIEEASEVIKAATKILRHGFESFNPHGGPETNSQALSREILDLSAVASAMGQAKDFFLTDRGHGFFSHAAYVVWERKQAWTHHQGHGEKG